MEPELIVRPLVVGPIAENTYLVAAKGSQEAMVIDPGAEGPRLLEEARRLGLRVVLVVNTHGHADHIGAVAHIVEATGATYAIHPADVPLIRRESPLSLVIPDFRSPPEADRLLAGGGEVRVGPLAFQVLETPGHTPGGICLYGQGVVFTGDTLFYMGIGRFDLPGGDGRTLLLGIQTHLLSLPEETVVYPGHGPRTTIGQEKRANPFLRQFVGPERS